MPSAPPLSLTQGYPNPVATHPPQYNPEYPADEPYPATPQPNVGARHVTGGVDPYEEEYTYSTFM
jgi:hypothetical protein